MSRNNLRLLPLPFALLAGLFSCSNSGTHIVEYAYAYGTNWEIHLYEGSKDDALEIVDYINKTSRLLDVDASASKGGIYTLNAAGEVDADPFFLEALKLGLEVEKEGHGAFCISVGALTDAWLSALEDGHVLEEAKRDALLSQAKSTTITIEGNHVSKSGNGKVDLGSIGKGLCLDGVSSILKGKGITRYFVNAGTSSLLFGLNPGNEQGVKVNLSDAKGRYFYAKDCAVSNSSVSRQRYEIDGVVYSHIIDARDGSAHLSYDALCLRGERAGYLDGLSTAYLALGEEYVSELEEKKIDYAFMKGGEVVHASPSFIL